MVNAAVLQQLKHGFKLQVNNSNPLFQTKPHSIFLPLSQSHPTIIRVYMKEGGKA